jgi:hypothetical protein
MTGKPNTYHRIKHDVEHIESRKMKERRNREVCFFYREGVFIEWTIAAHDKVLMMNGN